MFKKGWCNWPLMTQHVNARTHTNDYNKLLYNRRACHKTEDEQQIRESRSQTASEYRQQHTVVNGAIRSANDWQYFSTSGPSFTEGHRAV